MRTQLDKDKPIFETSNWYQSFGLLIVRVFFAGIVISAAVNFNQNHVATTIAIIFFGFLFVWIGQPSVVVYQDRFDYKFGSLFNLLNTHTTYFYKDIKSISLDGLYTQTFDMIEDSLPKSYLIPDTWNSIELEFKDGKRKSIGTRIYKGDLRNAVEFILQEYKRFNVSNEHHRRIGI
ncbi:MAG: hypothetical protein U0X76_03030 [Bacteroidia bacterium]